MKLVNYYIFHELWSRLELLQFINSVDFTQYDPLDENDVSTITNKYIAPHIADLPQQSLDTIRDTFAYYTSGMNAPLEALRNECQELSLDDGDDPGRFLDLVGYCLYGKHYKLGIRLEDYEERPDRSAAKRTFCHYR